MKKSDKYICFTALTQEPVSSSILFHGIPAAMSRTYTRHFL